MVLKYKVQIGYGGENISIDETELESAFYAFLEDGKAVFGNGICRGKDIISIKPDFHSALGINPDWKWTVDDSAELDKRGLRDKLNKTLRVKKERVQYLIQNGMQDMIGKNTEIKELGESNNKIDTSKIARELSI